jgi:chaperonin GroES
MAKSSNKIRPLDDRIVVEPLEAEEKTSGGILLPDSAKQRPQRGTIIAVGPGRLLENGERAACAVKVGDEVIYGRYSGNDVQVGDKDRDLKIMRESDVLAKVTK